jgi:Tfp pilus assembly protein PilX
MQSLPQKQRGVVLIVSLIFLLLITLVATSSSQTSTLQLQMAGNDQSRIEAKQRVLAAIDEIAQDGDNMPVVGNIGYKTCKSGISGGGCDTSSITLSSSVASLPANADMNYDVTRVGPLEAAAPTMGESQASSANFYKVARFEVNTAFDGSSARLGNSSMAQGVLVRVANPAN